MTGVLVVVAVVAVVAAAVLLAVAVVSIVATCAAVAVAVSSLIAFSDSFSQMLLLYCCSFVLGQPSKGTVFYCLHHCAHYHSALNTVSTGTFI
jgi:hypothetical protein